MRQTKKQMTTTTTTTLHDKQLRIGFDAKRALFNSTGLGNYSRLVVELMARRHPEWEISLFSPRDSRKALQRAATILGFDNVGVATPDSVVGRMLPSVWRSVAGLGRQASQSGINLFHGLSGELPGDIARCGVPTVVTVHDLIFNRCPDNYSAIDRRIYNRKFRDAVHSASRVVAISECTKRDIIEFYGISADAIDVVCQGCDPIFSNPVEPGRIAEVRAAYRLPERYIIAVGTVEKRKNQQQAISALPLLPDDVGLVIVGGEHGSYQHDLDRLIARLGVGKRVWRLRGVPFADLPPLYAGAVFSSYTSRYEGFGLPLIESLSCSTPVIAATGSCLEEAAGQGGLYVNPDDIDGYAEAALRLLDDSALRAELAACGAAHIERFSHDRFASQLEESYAKALS